MTAVPSTDRRIAVALAFFGLAIVAFWFVWFIDESLVVADTSAEYHNFEAAFPIADGWIALCLFRAALLEWRGDHRSALWLLHGSGAGMFLGLIDATYDFQHDLIGFSGNRLLETVIVATIFSASVAAAVLAVTRLRQLAGPSSSLMYGVVNTSAGSHEDRSSWKRAQ
jgi:hypothetical protein